MTKLTRCKGCGEWLSDVEKRHHGYPMCEECYRISTVLHEVQRKYSGRHMIKILRQQAYNAAYRSVDVSSNFTWQEWYYVLASYDFQCAFCLNEWPLQPDHIIGLAQGGSNIIDNIQPLCPSCNATKGNIQR